ncbi:DUF2306 domain-containing protein [Shimia marina]|uniref:DUF2306 domain-containing protein n=1 Tax=Shimia marina TaxID=321267 RepID=A0A0P1ENU6_9RHOB|nr:DUF2306 domain-containing protein [Shimia marina]CUH51971.1 hypothetical protein SHM7688_01411 [Shimia marina]SFE44222.1 Predicted membrane protein [Shimia marina]
MRVPCLLYLLCLPVLADSAERLIQVWTAPISSVDWIEARYLNAPQLSTLHLLPGLVFFVTGPLQFWPALRAPNLRSLHRLSGYLFSLSAVLSSLAIMVMVLTFPAIGGTLTIIGTYLICLGMLISIGCALWSIRRKDVPLHKISMAFAFTLGLSVATARWFIYGAEWLCDIPFIESFAPASILAGLTNLSVCSFFWRKDIKRQYHRLLPHP